MAWARITSADSTTQHACTEWLQLGIGIGIELGIGIDIGQCTEYELCYRYTSILRQGKWSYANDAIAAAVR